MNFTIFEDLVHHSDAVAVGAVGHEVKSALSQAVHGVHITASLQQVLGDLKAPLLQRQQQRRLARPVRTVDIGSCKKQQFSISYNGQL